MRGGTSLPETPLAVFSVQLFACSFSLAVISLLLHCFIFIFSQRRRAGAGRSWGRPLENNNQPRTQPEPRTIDHGNRHASAQGAVADSCGWVEFMYGFTNL